MKIILSQTLRIFLISCLFAGIFTISASAHEYCPSQSQSFEIFQEITTDLTNKGYRLVLNPKPCAMVVEAVKEGVSLNHGIANTTWKIETVATVYYVWNGAHYQFIDFGEFYTRSKAPMGNWSITSHTNGKEEQETEVRTMFLVTYRSIYAPRFLNSEDLFLVKKISRGGTARFPYIYLNVKNERDGSIWHLRYRDNFTMRFSLNEMIRIRISVDRGIEIYHFYKENANEEERGWVCCFEILEQYVE